MAKPFDLNNLVTDEERTNAGQSNCPIGLYAGHKVSSLILAMPQVVQGLSFLMPELARMQFFDKEDMASMLLQHECKTQLYPSETQYSQILATLQNLSRDKDYSLNVIDIADSMSSHIEVVCQMIRSEAAHTALGKTTVHALLYAYIVLGAQISAALAHSYITFMHEEEAKKMAEAEAAKAQEVQAVLEDIAKSGIPIVAETLESPDFSVPFEAAQIIEFEEGESNEH